MHCSLKNLVLATLAVGQASAASIAHAHSAFHQHARKHEHAAPQKRATALTDADASRLTALGIGALGINAAEASGTAWLGEGGAWTNEFINNSGEDVVVVVWGTMGSWVNAVQPAITASLGPNASTLVSFPNGFSGAWSAIYPDTQLVNGQVHETWGEITVDPMYGVFDCSREVNMQGHGMAIVGPTCTSDMNQCVFVCPEGQLSCEFNYILQNCETGSQAGANYGTYDGAPSGGCGGNGANAALKTYLG